MKIKGLAVELVEGEVVEFCEEAIGGNFEEFGGLFVVVFEVFVELCEDVGTLLYEPCGFIHDLGDNSQSVTGLDDCLKFYLSYLSDDHFVDFQELFEDGVVF